MITNSLNFSPVKSLNFPQNLSNIAAPTAAPGLTGSPDDAMNFSGAAQLPAYGPSLTLQLARSPEQIHKERLHAKNLMNALSGHDDKIEVKATPCKKAQAQREAGDRLRHQYNDQIKAQAAQLTSQGFRVNFS